MPGATDPGSPMADPVVALLGVSADEAIPALSRAAEPFLPHAGAIAVVDGRLLTEPPLAGDEAVTASEVVGLAERATGSPAYGVLPASRGGRPAVVFVATNRRAAGAILVLTDATASTAAYRSVSLLWEVASHVIVAASPDFPTADDRTIDSEWRNQLRMVRNETSATLRGILAALRSRKLDDKAARQLAVTLAAQALTTVRSDTVHQELTAGEAFSISTDALRPIVQNSDVELQLAPPDDTAQVVPDLVARTATLVARGVMLMMLEHTAPHRIRVGWDVTQERLLLNVRDDGDGASFPAPMVLFRMRERLAPMGGTVSVDAVPGWGTTATAEIPLDAPDPGSVEGPDALSSLTEREREILGELVRGRRNRQIAENLHLSEHTVKFHVHAILRKLGASSRGEAAAIARTALGLGPRT